MASGDAIRYLKAREILEAIEFAKNEKDPKGLNAVQIDVANKQKRESVTYLPVKVNVLNGVGPDGKPKREWLDLHMMFRKVNTRAKIVPHAERILQKIKSVTLQFRTTSKSYWLNQASKQEEEDPIGEALDQLDSIIQAKILLHLKAKDPAKRIVWDNAKLNMFVQRGMRNEAGEMTKKFEDPIIRIEVKFRAKEKGALVPPTALPWQCTIHDANKLRPKNKPAPKGEPPYEYAKIDNGEGTDEEFINFRNIHKLITPGSSITGYINASQISLSSFGISHSPRFTSLIVKKSLGFQADYTAMEGQLDGLGDATVENYDETEGAGGDTPGGAGKPSGGKSADYKNEASEFDDDAGDAGDLNDGVAEDDLPAEDDLDDNL
jgi:hypothetical protein